jgi:hypothetical protein
VPASTIARPCCEFVRGATPDARAPHTVEAPQLQPAPLAAILPPPTSLVDLFGSAAGTVASQPRGQPPGAHLREFSQILRV